MKSAPAMDVHRIRAGSNHIGVSFVDSVHRERLSVVGDDVMYFMNNLRNLGELCYKRI